MLAEARQNQRITGMPSDDIIPFLSFLLHARFTEVLKSTEGRTRIVTSILIKLSER